MADAATGTLVLVALSGGTGAFLGVVVNQLAQSRRDKEQREHENDRHDRERQQALEDERTKRREDRYVTLLTELTRLDRVLQDTVLMVDEVVRYRDLAELPQALRSGSGERTESRRRWSDCSWPAFGPTRRSVRRAPGHGFWRSVELSGPPSRWEVPRRNRR